VWQRKAWVTIFIWVGARAKSERIESVGIPIGHEF
jgi:hypothetical protein